jgi:AAA domain
VDVKPLLPYQAHGAATELFFGRDYELERLIGGNRHGGIIIGAHRSGKTSLLHNIGERLKHRGRTVIGPITPTGVGSFQSFFERTLHSLAINCSIDMNPELWASALRKAHMEKEHKERFVFLLDEVDDLLKIDFEAGSILGRQMRSLQSDGQCEFYLAGHKALHNAIALEEGPLRNFAEEIVLTGLTQKASMRLIQEPMENLGFSISNEQALRIFQGTAGVAVLIQEFCIRLLCRDVPSIDKSEIEDSVIENIEKSSDYLNVVFDHYEYGQKWTSFCIMLIAAIHKEVSRQDLMQEIDKHGIRLSRSQLDESLKFLTKFGVLEEKELKPGYYSILPKYLSLAIMTRDPDMLLNEKIEEGKKEMCYD